MLGEGGLLAATKVGEDWQLDVSVGVDVGWGDESKLGEP